MLEFVSIHISKQPHQWRNGGVMVSEHTSSTVDRGFEPRYGQTKGHSIGICCFSAKHAPLRRKSKYWLGWNQNNISECGAIGRSANCCFSGVALYKSNSACWSRTKRTSSSFHWKLICSRHNIAAKIPNWR